MNPSLQIRVYRRQQLCHTARLSEELQIGRQRPGEPAPYHFDAAASRLIVAPIDDKLISREHLSFSAIDNAGGLPSPQLRIRNLSRKRSVIIDNYGKLGPEQSQQLGVPVVVSFEDFAIRVETSPSSAWELHSLEHPTLAPGTQLGSRGQSGLISQKTLLQTSAKANYSSEQLIHWLGETMEVLQGAAGASDFLAQAVQAVHRILGLDAIAALRYEGGQWSVATTKDTHRDQAGSDSRSPSRTILQEIFEKKRTVFQVPTGSGATASLQGVKALVAAPILSADGDVIGALYGARYGTLSQQMPQISELEATMVEVIACGAAAGIAREVQQQKALAARIQFEQFFPPQLARELETNPRLLEGHDAEISVLFCDIVGFSSISQRIGSQLTMHWISDVMEHLSAAVLENHGVVVDYIGDELMAMWGAPKAQIDHEQKACLTSIELLRCRQRIDQVWRDRIGQAIDFRIGICSGIAGVGNTGSKRRLKYGPLGNTVNLASRLQNAAKHFGVRQLVNRATAVRIQDHAMLCCRPLGTARFVNLATPIEVFELGLSEEGKFSEIASVFEQALEEIRRGNLSQAQKRLDQLCAQYPQDVPTQKLARRLESDSNIDPKCIWHFDTK